MCVQSLTLWAEAARARREERRRRHTDLPSTLPPAVPPPAVRSAEPDGAAVAQPKEVPAGHAAKVLVG